MLTKNPEERWQTARDVALELQWVAESGAQTGILAPGDQRKIGRELIAWSFAALLGIGAVLIASLHWGRRPPVAQPVRFELPLPAGALSFTLSPDGRWLAFPAPGPDGRNFIWIRALDSLEPRSLPGTENVRAPVFWSPDSRFIAFQTGSRLEQIDVYGGPPKPICDTSETELGGAWSRDGTIIFGTIGNGVMRVPAAGGAATPVTAVNGRNEVHVFPSFLPDGRHFVYLRAQEIPASTSVHLTRNRATKCQASARHPGYGGLCSFHWTRHGTIALYARGSATVVVTVEWPCCEYG